MAEYSVDIDLNNKNTSHTQIVELVGHDRAVLDVGCWTGDVGRALLERGCTVSGVEIDPDAAAIARRDLAEVVVLNLDTAALVDHFADGSFDVIVLGDVLEHLMDPVAALVSATPLLAPGGRFVISIPNVTHGSVRLALLQGRWDYTETGLLDRTHIKFFSRQGLLRMMHDAGLVVEDLRATLADPLGVEVVVDDSRLPSAVVEWVRDQRDALAYQFVLSARPATAAEQEAQSEPLVAGAALPEAVRARDSHTEASEADLEARRRLLTVRDHIVGLEATASAAEAKAARTTSRARRSRDRLETVRKNNVRLRRRVRELEGELAAERSMGARLHMRQAIARRLGRA